MGRRPQVSALIGSVLVVAPFLAACSGGEEALDGTWEPVDVPAAQLGADFPSQQALLTLDGGEFVGHDGCNSETEYSGSFELAGDALSVDIDAQNQVGSDCESGVLNWFQVLKQVDTANVDEEGMLQLRDAQGQLVASLRPTRE